MIALLGVGPLPAPGRTKVVAPGLRLEAFLRRLVADGQEVAVGELSFPGTEPSGSAEGAASYCAIPGGLGARDAVERWLAEVNPAAVVTQTEVAARLVAMSSWDGPLHVDFNGHPMAEREQQAAVHGSNAALAEQWLGVLPVLLRADHFSVCSESQRLALAGELGAAGRMNAENCAVRNLIVPISADVPYTEPFKLTDPDYLVKRGVPRDARIIFSSGGFNTWVDEESLFRGVDSVLGTDPNAWFVMTGGAIEGHVTVVFERFCERVAASPHRDRFLMLGWVPTTEWVDALLLSHVAVNMDRWSWEGELGYRTRLLGWMWAGIHIVTTSSNKFIDEFEKEGLLRVVGHVPHFVSEVRKALDIPKRTDLDQVHLLLRQKFMSQSNFIHLLQWCRDPKRAPDRQHGPVSNPLADLQRGFLDLATREREHAEVRKVAHDAAEMLLGSRAFDVYSKLKPDHLAALQRLRDL